MKKKYYEEKLRKDFIKYLQTREKMTYRKWKKLPHTWKREICIDFYIWMYM